MKAVTNRQNPHSIPAEAARPFTNAAGDGRWIPAIFSRASGAVRDVTKRRLAEKETLELRENLLVNAMDALEGCAPDQRIIQVISNQ